MGTSGQLALAIEAPTEGASPASQPELFIVSNSRSNGSASPAEDALLRTSDVVRIVRHHRCTLYRWMRAGEFPQRHRGKGWKRSEIERWLASDAARSAN
jgi:predicted DNA-binding transcriptional regulator AlpA